MSRPSALSIVTAATSSPSVSSCARSRSVPSTRAAITSGVSWNSSHTLVPVVTARSSRAPACTRTTLIWDTDGSWCGTAGRGPGDRIDGLPVRHTGQVPRSVHRVLCVRLAGDLVPYLDGRFDRGLVVLSAAPLADQARRCRHRAGTRRAVHDRVHVDPRVAVP